MCVYVLVLTVCVCACFGVCVCVMCVYVCASKDYKRHRPMNASYEKDAYSNVFYWMFSNTKIYIRLQQNKR